MYFNNVDLSDYLKIKTINGRGLSPSELNLINIPGMDGAYLQDKKTPVRVLEIEANIIADNKEELRIKIDELNGILSVDEPVPITFSDEPSMTYYGITESTGQNNEFFFMHDGTLTIMCIDPYKYGPEKEKELDFKTTVNNEGSAEAFPTFELEVLEPITFAMVQNQDEEYLLIGEPVDEDVQVVEKNVLVYDSNGEDVNEWSTSPVNIDDINNQIVSGEMGFDGTGFIATDYGTGDYGHGPAIIRELSQDIKDFEVEVIFDTRDEDVIENFRTEVYLFSDGMDMIGKIGVNDNTASLARRRAHGRVGEHTNLSDPSYVINPTNYQYDNLGLATFFMRVRRKGFQFVFYIARIDERGRHVDSLERSYTTLDSEVLQDLKYIQLYIRTFDNRPVSLARINRVRVFKLNEVTVDQTPYIATTGDTIVFDSQNEEMLLNGEGATRLKDFGATYFTLKKGVNELIIHPTESFNAMLRYRERSK